LLIGLTLIASLVCCAPSAARAGVFSDWAVIVVAGDDHAHSGAISNVFDNARRDLVKALIARGFSADNIRQYSLRPDAYPHDGAQPTQSLLIVHQLEQLSDNTRGGCLLYLTSHGSPEGVLVGDRTWTPNMVSALLSDTCTNRPVVVIISACFSGVFVSPLDDANRMVLTAARPDRTSFGCGEADRYTYFDGCVLHEIGAAHDFVALAHHVQACVAKEEQDTHMSPPSEPQLDIGAALRPTLPLYAFTAPP
jgi:hypothetical protein